MKTSHISYQRQLKSYSSTTLCDENLKHEGSKKTLIFKTFRHNSIFAPFPHPLSHSDGILAILILQASLISLKYTNCETRI